MIKGSKNYLLMSFTKTTEELQARRDRVKQMIANGDVMTPSKRTSMMKRQREAQKLQDKADLILAGVNAPVRRSTTPMGSSAPAAKEVAPVANTQLPRTVKVDTLAATADGILRELLGS